MQTDFLTLNLTGITSNKASFTQFGTQGLVVLHQSTSDTVADRTNLTEMPPPLTVMYRSSFSVISTSSSG